jgi:hypothetical protein
MYRGVMRNGSGEIIVNNLSQGARFHFLQGKILGRKQKSLDYKVTLACIILI